MKVRKLAIALALAGGLGSGIAQALGLGEIELQSYLNEPLDAEITLTASRGVDPAEVFVNIAPESAYERVGISRNHFLSKLRFEVVTGPDGNLVVNVSSREPLREPYLNFLLELTWPNGRLMREYAVLVDPPVYAEKSGLEESVAAPVTGTAGDRKETAEAPRRDSRTGQPAPTTGGGQPATIGPTTASDTLWGIAARIRPDNSVSVQQVMLAIQDLNPDAFIGGNINRLKKGQVLRIPSLEEIQRRSRAEAVRLVASQNEAFEASRRAVDTAAEPAVAPAATAVAEGDAELRLLVANNEGARDTEDGGSAGGDSQLPGGVDAGTAVAMEELERVRRENDELSSRVEDLQDQVETLQRLLELKNSQLADLQHLAAQQDTPAAAESPEAAAEDETGTPEEADAGMGMAEQEEALPAEADTAGDGSRGMPGESMTESAEGATPADAGEDGATPADTDEADTEAEVSPPAPAPKPAPVSPPPEPVADKGFPANIIDLVMRNPMYQIALGGGLVVVLLLLLLAARHRASQEQDFLDELNSGSGDDEDAFDFTGETSEAETADSEAARDPLEEADACVSAGQLEQAAQLLEEAISREPSRTDLRLKLLGIYADNQDRESFDKQLGEIEALDDEETLAKAQELKERLEEAESIPSIDDLESQLRSDSFAPEMMGEPETPATPSTGLMEDQSETAPEEETENEFGELASDISLEDTDLQALAEEAENDTRDGNPDGSIEYDLSSLEEEAAADSESVEAEASETEKTEEDDFSIDFELPEEDENTAADESDLASLGDLDDIEDLELPTADTADETAEDEAADDSGISLDDLDDSFLEDLDAELDKVVEDTGSEEEALDELDLDISDEDLALMEEFSESGEPSPGDREADSAGEAETPEANPAEEVPVASELADEHRDSGDGLPEIDEESLENEDDFSFLDGTDEAATKLDLARAYMEMGDQDGARDILEEVAIEGNEEQKAEARELLKKIS